MENGQDIGTWNVKDLYRVGSLKIAVSEKYILDLVAIQEVKWVDGGGQPADDYIFLEMGMLIII
jgi:hypothetical protein